MNKFVRNGSKVKLSPLNLENEKQQREKTTADLQVMKKKGSNVKKLPPLTLRAERAVDLQDMIKKREEAIEAKVLADAKAEKKNAEDAAESAKDGLDYVAQIEEREAEEEARLAREKAKEDSKVAKKKALTGGKKSLIVNEIKQIAYKLKVSLSKCKNKESIISKIKSIDLQKLTIEQLKIYCNLFNIKGCSKCKSKKSLLLHTKSNMKIR